VRRLRAAVTALAALGVAPIAQAAPAPPPLPASPVAIVTTSPGSPTAVVGSDVEVDVDVVTENVVTNAPETGSLTTHVPSNAARVVSVTPDSGSCTTSVLCTFTNVPGDWHVHVAIVLQPLVAGTTTLQLQTQFQGTGFLSNVSGQGTATITATEPVADLKTLLTTNSAKPAVGRSLTAVLWVVNGGGDSSSAATVSVRGSAGMRIVGLAPLEIATCDLAARSCTTQALGTAAGAKIVVTLVASKPGSSALTATVAGARGDTDPDAANNRAKLVFKVHPAPAKR
jgi:hypothetical protein